MGMERWRCWQNMSWNPEDLQSQNLHRKARCTHLITALVGVVLEVAEIGRSLGLAGHPANLTYSVGSKSIRDNFPKWKSEERRGGVRKGRMEGGRKELFQTQYVHIWNSQRIHRVGRGMRVGGDEKEEGVYVDSFWWITHKDGSLASICTYMHAHLYTHEPAPC